MPFRRTKGNHSDRQRSLAAFALAAVGALAAPAAAQDVREGNPVSPSHRSMYERGLEYLVKNQQSRGSFDSDAGITGICVMALLASGEDPNFGRYATSVRNGIRSLIDSQSASTGQIGSGMYQHGFAMLCLADCYGAVDDRLLARDYPDIKRTIGEALELAVRCAVTSQNKNQFNAWRYSPDSNDADTSVAGAVMMGLLGARNAGVAVPDESIDKALAYFTSMTSSEGDVGYSGIGSFGMSKARTAIVATVFAVAKRRESLTFKSTKSRIVATRRGADGGWGHPCYTRYYVSQALFQTDHAAWREWSEENTRDLIARQADDGSINIEGTWRSGCYPTGMLLLSCALDYTFLPIYER